MKHAHLKKKKQRIFRPQHVSRAEGGDPLSQKRWVPSGALVSSLSTLPPYNADDFVMEVANYSFLYSCILFIWQFNVFDFILRKITSSA